MENRIKDAQKMARRLIGSYMGVKPKEEVLLPSIADMQTANFAGGAMEAGIIRRRIKQLHLYAHSNGTAVDELVGSGCVSKLEIA